MVGHNVAQRGDSRQGRSRYQPKAHQVFRRAREWQFGDAAKGRKWRGIQSRLRMLARVLAMYDRSGECRSIYSATDTMLLDVRKLEARHAEEYGVKART